MKIPLREVQLSKSRPTMPDAVNALAESLRASGLINPIIVKRGTVYDGAIYVEGYKVIAGNHRVSAARALGWTEIDAFLHDGDDIHAELLEIDENLQRAELSPAQRAVAISRRKELWEVLHPGGNSVPTLGGEQRVGFAGDTAKAAGLTKRAINEHVARAAALGPDIHEVVGTSLDKGVELDALKDMPADERRELIERAKAGEAVSARTKPEKDPQLASRLVAVVAGDFARMLGKVSAQDVAEAMATQAINPDLKPYIEAFYNAYRAFKRVA